MIRGHPLWATCPSCGGFKAEGMPCRKCGYMGSPIPAKGIFHFPIKQDQVPASMGGTLTFSASSSKAIQGLFQVEEKIMNSELDPNERIQLRSYIGLAQEIIHERAKERIEKYPDHITKYKEQIELLSSLIEKDAEEPDFQEFFTSYPNFLVPDQMNTESKPNYGGEFEPDFMIESSTSIHWIIEIEKPGKQLFTSKNNQPRAEFSQALQQIRDYLHWARTNIQFLKDTSRTTVNWPRLQQENIRGLLVIGKRSDLGTREKVNLEAMNHEVRSSYQIKTFDDILNENIALHKNWKEM